MHLLHTDEIIPYVANNELLKLRNYFFARIVKECEHEIVFDKKIFMNAKKFKHCTLFCFYYQTI